VTLTVQKTIKSKPLGILVWNLGIYHCSHGATFGAILSEIWDSAHGTFLNIGWVGMEWPIYWIHSVFQMSGYNKWFELVSYLLPWHDLFILFTKIGLKLTCTFLENLQTAEAKLILEVSENPFSCKTFIQTSHSTAFECLKTFTLSLIFTK